MEPAIPGGMLVGEVLGRYRVVEPLGEGSMATVYAGEHVVLGHRVAIKIMHPEYMRDSHMEQRLLREARALAAIRHPGIVQLVDIGRGPGGRAYIIMELLQGETLAHRLQAGALPEPHMLVFARQLASALAAAHAHDIVHRDLKPENVFVVRDPAVPLGERAKIFDFGIAKRTPVHLTPSPRITKVGVVVGTPEYMSPEQCAGGAVDERSDIYSLGVVMFRMATGELPFDGTTSEMIANHRYVESPRASAVRPDLSAQLDETIARCLAKDAADRFGAMTEIVEALDDIDDVDALPEDTAPFVIEPRRQGSSDSGLITMEMVEAGAEDPEATFDIPRPGRARRGRAILAALGAAAAVALVAAGAFAMLSRGGDGSEPTPVADEAAPAHEPGDRRREAHQPELEPEPTPPPTVAQLEEPAPREAPREARDERQAKPQARAGAAAPVEKSTPKVRSRAKPKPKRTARRRPKPKPRDRPEPEPEPEPEDPFTNVVTPTVF